MGRRSDHSKEEIQSMALQAAKKIIAAEGLAGLSARKIASAIGYTVGTLYLVFDNLDDLIIQVNAATLDDMHCYLRERVKRCKKPEQIIHVLGKGYIQFAGDNRGLWNAIFDHHLPSGHKLPQWFMEKVLNNFAMVEQALQPYAGKLSANKRLMLSRALWGGVHGICVLGFSGKIDVDQSNAVQVLADTLIKHFLAGLAAQ